MGIKKGKTDYLLSLIREGKSMTLGQQLRLTAYLSVPAIMAQVSSIAMQYIDASMLVAGCECSGFHRIGFNHDMAVLGIVCRRCNGIFCPSGTPDWGRRFCRSEKNTPPIGYGYTCFQFFVGGCRHFYQWCASRLAGW